MGKGERVRAKSQERKLRAECINHRFLLFPLPFYPFPLFPFSYSHHHTRTHYRFRTGWIYFGQGVLQYFFQQLGCHIKAGD